MMKNGLRTIILLAFIAVGITMMARDSVVLAPSYAWTISKPLGQRFESTIDTLQDNYAQNFVPVNQSLVYATTGNYGAPGQTQVFFERKHTSDFFFEDALDAWIKDLGGQKFYNTRTPMTILSYSTGGTKYNNQDRLSGIFSGNVNKRLQIGAMLDYIYSKGALEYQAAKNFKWGFSGSYTGDRYELQTYFNSYRSLNKETGGITDDRYITDPGEVQGGEIKVDYKNIPTNLNSASSRVRGSNFMMNHRYKVGYYRTWKDSVNDTIEHKEYVPVTSFIWTMDYKTNVHRYKDSNSTEDLKYYENTYLSEFGTDEQTEFWKLSNTLGVSMLEGFNKYVKFGLSAYATYEIRKFTQVEDSALYITDRSAELSPAPDFRVPHKGTENVAWVGGQLTKQKGSILTYNADVRFGLLGSVVGDIDISGNVTTRIPLWGDSLKISGFGYFKNEEVPYLLRNYVSNHFIWKNDFGKVRRFRVGGRLNIPHSGTFLEAGVENMQNYVYFDNAGKPAQYGDHIQVLSLSAKQNLRFKALNWDNKLTYQTSSKESVLSLPKFAVYSNLYLKFLVAKVMHVQLGVDANYYTKYYAPGYMPATMAFHTQNEVKCGNFLWMNAYVNVKLKKTRFFLMFSHVNQGLFGGKEYFSLPHYPLNPRKFQMGLSVDFAN